MSNNALVNLRLNNKASVLYKLMSYGEMSRLTLSRELNLTTSSLTHIVKELLLDELVTEVSSVNTGKRGRREVLLKFNPAKYVAIGVNIESDNTHISITSYNEILSEEIIDTVTLFSDGISILSDKIRHLISDYSRYNIMGVCVGICGKVDVNRGISVQSFNILPDNYPLLKNLQGALTVPVFVVNNVKAQAECLITEKNKNFLYIKHSPGIGCAMVDGGHVVEGFTGIAGELGHTTVVPNGLSCRCGKLGCLEAYASEHGINEQYFLKTGKHKNILEIYSSFNCDATANEILNNATDYIALSIANASALLNPEQIVLTGGIFSNDNLLNIISEKIKKFGSFTEINKLPDEYKIKAFAETRYILIQKLFEVKNEKEN